MTLAEFADNNRGINGGADLPLALLASLYTAVQAREIRAHPEAQPEGGDSGGGCGGGGSGGSGSGPGGVGEPPSHDRCAYLRLRRGLPSSEAGEAAPPADDSSALRAAPLELEAHLSFQLCPVVLQA